MDENMKPKVVSIEIKKEGSMPMNDKGDPRLAAKKQLLSNLKSMAVKAMKDNIQPMDEEIDEAMDCAPGIGIKEDMEDEEKDMKEEMSGEIKKLPENPGESKDAKLKALMGELEDLKSRISQLLE